MFLMLRPIGEAVSAAANTLGFQRAPSPDASFEAAGPSEGTVNLADFGGMPLPGDLYGTLSISGTSVSCNLYYGDSENELHAGAGTSALGGIPGQEAAALIGGHTGTYFRDLESAQLDASITIQTKYGEYVYKITQMDVVRADEFGMDELNAAPAKSVLLYTCYPFGQLSLTPYRYMILGEYVSGPVLAETTEAGA